jgi:hypothetical protein
VLRSARFKRSVATAVSALGALTLAAPQALAAGSDVPCDSTALVLAVTAANATSTPDTLSLAPNCVYTLTSVADSANASGLPAIRGTLTVNGNHATITRAADAPQFRIVSSWGDLTLNDVTISGGRAPDGVGTDTYGTGTSGDGGGGIQSWGPLAITDSVITGNTAGAGAPGADAGTASAGRGGLGGFGGGISAYSSTGAPLTITDTVISNNTTGAAGPGGNGTGTQSGGRGGSGGFGGGIDASSNIMLRITGSAIVDNAAAPGGQGGSGGADRGSGGDGGSGGSAGGVSVGTQLTDVKSPVITNTKIAHNLAGHGGDTGVPGTDGYQGRAGYGGGGGGLTVFYDTLTLDGGSIGDNTAGEPGAGAWPLRASGGGVYTLVSAHVTLANGAEVSGNHPNNCDKVADVPGCVNDQPGAARAQHTDATGARDRQVADLAGAQRTASSRVAG